MEMLVNFIIVALAAYRVSDMLADPFQEGPFGILLKFRDKVGVYFDEYSTAQGRNNFSRGLLCQYCNSVWVGLVFTVIILGLSLVDFPIWVVFLPFAISGFVVMIKEFTDGN